MSVTVLVTHARCSLPAGTPWVELPRFLVSSCHFSLDAAMRPPFFCRSTVGQFAQQPAQGHFRLSGLEAALEPSLGQPLGLGVTYALAEEIGVATEVLDRRERDRIDP